MSRWEVVREDGRHVKHGEGHTRLWNVWRAMRQRCTNPHDSNFYLYGGRGIAVCDEWNSYIVFRDWALAAGYASGLTIDRINNNLGYSPDNCRWATRRQQGRNQRTNRPVIRSDGKYYGTTEEAAEDVGGCQQNIQATCARRRNSAYSYGWRYANHPRPVSLPLALF